MVVLRRVFFALNLRFSIWSNDLLFVIIWKDTLLSTSLKTVLGDAGRFFLVFISPHNNAIVYLAIRHNINNRKNIMIIKYYAHKHYIDEEQAAGGVEKILHIIDDVTDIWVRPNNKLKNDDDRNDYFDYIKDELPADHMKISFYKNGAPKVLRIGFGIEVYICNDHGKTIEKVIYQG